MTAANLVKMFIKNNKIAVFSKSYCPYCDMAKKVLDEAGAKNKAVLELNERNDGDQIQSILCNITGQSTVPQVFFKETFIGGGTELSEFHSTGKLKKLLSKL